MTPDSITLLDSIVTESAEALLAAYDTAIGPSAPPEPAAARKVDLELGSLAGFVGDTARGNLVVSMSADLLEKTCPGDSTRDWIGEIANQLLGRIKNKLIPYGLTLDVAPPVVVSGWVRISGLRDTVRAYSLSAGEGQMSVWFRIQLDEGTELVLDTDPANQPSAEGDVMLF